MKKLLLMSTIAIAALLLAACGPGTIPTIDDRLIATYAAQTVEARLNEIIIKTQIALLTQVAQGTNTPAPTIMPSATLTTAPTYTPQPTYTPLPTFTPLATFTPVAPTAVPIPCNRAGFVDDVSVPDGTTFAPGDDFTKTWLIKNTGSCTWNKDYLIVFKSGDALGSPATKKINVEVKPGASAKISLDLVAPDNSGDYQGNWMLRSDNGITFGLGPSADKSFWTAITVAKYPKPPAGVTFDFSKNYCSADWKNSKGDIGCPGEEDDFTNGSVRRSLKPRFENSTTDDEPTLIMIPNKGDNGRIAGKYPEFEVPSSATFTALIGCMYDSPKCDVTFVLKYRISGSSTTETLDTWGEKYDKKIQNISVDLSSLAGEKVSFTLEVQSKDNNSDDRAFWLFPRVIE
ncbi:MAG: hypothetical protein HGA53_02765 [Anaerolineaceae bacterium]|nr:hypothetical protein [Anaerolineaceae bacterium]NTV35851.1 hypothetical protein [Anaerolineaceae bacterium]